MGVVFSSAVPRRRRNPYYLILLLAGLPCASAAQSPLTLAEAQRIAVERSRQLAARDESAAAAREMAAAAGRLPDPALRFGVENLPVEGTDAWSLTRDFMTMRRIGVMQEFTRGEKRQLRAERYEREAELALVEKSAATALIQRDTAIAWLERHYAERMTGLLAGQIAAARHESEAVAARYRAGRGGQDEVFAARSAVVGLEDRASEIGRRIRTATTALARWVGEAAAAPLAGKPDVEGVGLDETALDSQLAHHPQIAALAKQVEIAATEAKLAQAGKTPDWSVEISYSARGSAYSNMVTLGVAVPLQWDQKNRQDREVAAKLALARQAEAQREDALRAHVAEVRSMIGEWENLRERRTRLERELAPLAAERARALLAAWRGGKASLAEVLSARRAETDVRLQVLQLELEHARLWAQLHFLVPRPATLTGVSR